MNKDKKATPFFERFLEDQNRNLNDVKAGKLVGGDPTMKYPSDDDVVE